MNDIQSLFNECEIHLLKDERPSEFFNYAVKNYPLFKAFPFALLSELMNVPQSPRHHPEGNVWNHTMMVVNNAAQKKELSQNSRAFMWAALLHDLGKAPTTRIRRDRITSYDHDKAGQKLAETFLRGFLEDEDFIRQVSVLVRWHMQILFVVKDLPFAEIEKMAGDVAVDEIALLSLCDRLGRGGMTRDKVNEEEENIQLFLSKCQRHLLDISKA